MPHKITTAPGIIAGVTSHADALRLLKQQSSRTKQPVALGVGTLAPYVNQGRWVADCACGSGIAVDPDWPHGVCFDCCTKWVVAWMAQGKRKQIEKALERRRDRKRQNWLAHELAASLDAENAAHAADCEQ